MLNSTLLSRAGQQFVTLLGNQKFLLFFTRVGEYIAPRLKICFTCVGLNEVYNDLSTQKPGLRSRAFQNIGFRIGFNLFIIQDFYQ